MPKKKKRKNVLTFEVPLATTLEQAAEMLGGWDELLRFFEQSRRVSELRAKRQEAFKAMRKVTSHGSLSAQELLALLEGRKPKRKK